MTNTQLKKTLSWRLNTGGIFDLVLAQFDQAENQAFDQILQYLGQLNPDSATAEAVAEALYNIVKHDYNLKISSTEFKELVHKQTSSIYRDLVKNDATLPRINFSLPDERAMVYLNNSDLVYLGKYIEDAALRTRITEYIKEAYLKNGRAIGNSTKELNAFMKVFKEELDASKAKVRMIIDTTVSRARVFGQVNGLRAAGAKTFGIAGPLDSHTCAFCADMVGRTFDVPQEIKAQDSFIQAGPENANHLRPFLKGSLALEDLQDMDDTEVQDGGFAAPPYHPSCRHRLVAVSFYANLDEVPYSLA